MCARSGNLSGRFDNGVAKAIVGGLLSSVLIRKHIEPGGTFLLGFNRHYYSEIKGQHPAYNMASCDGHVESVKREKLFEKSEAWARRWFIDNQPHKDLWFDFVDP